MSPKPVDIYGITESRLSSSFTDTILNIPGYTLFRLDRVRNKYGGVAAYVSNCLSVEHRTDLETVNIESLWLQLKQTNSKSILIGFIYRPPNALVEWYEHFENEIVRVMNEGTHVIVMGDFNIDLLVKENTRWPISHMDSYNFW